MQIEEEFYVITKKFFFFASQVAKCEPVLCAHMHGGGRGEAPHSAHSVLLKDLQRLGAFTTRRQHYIWLQGERSDLFAGKSLSEDEEEEEEERRGGWVGAEVQSPRLSIFDDQMFLRNNSDKHPRYL